MFNGDLMVNNWVRIFKKYHYTIETPVFRIKIRRQKLYFQITYPVMYNKLN